MKTLFLVRHGENIWNREHRLGGWTDVPLTPLGRSQAAALAPELAGERFDGVWSSDLVRAWKTAELAGFAPEKLPDLREIHFGLLEGRRWEGLEPALQEAMLGFEHFRAPGGEATMGVLKRVSGFVESLPAGRHLVFSHAGVMRALLWLSGDLQIIPHTTVYVYEWPAKRLVEVWRKD
ncbi:histidine phosphatase family protein [Oceanithermus sp.]